MSKRNRRAQEPTGRHAAAAEAEGSALPALQDLHADDESDSDSEEELGRGLSGLDAIIAATQQRPGRSGAPIPVGGLPSTSSEEFHSLDDASESSDAESADAGAASPVAAAGGATDLALAGAGVGADSKGQLRERRASDRLASTSLLRDEAFTADAGSDSSEDERPDRNTVGAVPLEWYRDEEHIGYDREGKALKKRGKRGDMLDAVLARNDSPGAALRTLYDPYNDEEITLSREELRTLINIQQGRMPEVHIDPYQDLVDWYTNEEDPHPVQNAPEPKRRFMPSKWEEKKIVKLVRAIRRGWLKPRAEREAEAEAPPVYMLWADDAAADNARTGAGLTYIPAPKPELPSHEESYNPPAEYLPSEADRATHAQAEADGDDVPWLARSFDALRAVPQYDKIVHERFERCLDLYLCPRVRSKRVNYKPEDLVPKELPSAGDLRPYPNTLSITYHGHQSKVRSIVCDPTGQCLLTGSDDGTVRLWDVLTGHCRRSWDLGAKVHAVAWCPDVQLRIVSCVVENKVVLLASGTGGEAVAEAAARALDAPPADAASEKLLTRWARRDDGGLEVVHSHQLRHIAWHSRGDYFSTTAPDGATRSVVVHQLSRFSSQNPFRKNRGRVTCTSFHPTKPWFLVATQNNVRVYNLAKQTLMKKLLAGGGVVTSMSVHSSGDHVLLGTEDNRCLWFDLDLSAKPYKVMKYHEGGVRSVAYHRARPLFASASDDGTVQVFHGRVYQDLMTNPLVVPVKILAQHRIRDHSGVMGVCFHPSQPWVFTAGADGTACLFVDV